MTDLAALVGEVEAAIAELRDHYTVSAIATGDGGAVVTVHDFPFGPRWTPASGDLSFVIPFNYPYAPIYPYYATAALVPADGRPRPQALQTVQWNNGSYTQISLRTNGWSPAVNTAVIAVAQVEEQFRSIL